MAKKKVKPKKAVKKSKKPARSIKKRPIREKVHKKPAHKAHKKPVRGKKGMMKPGLMPREKAELPKRVEVDMMPVLEQFMGSEDAGETLMEMEKGLESFANFMKVLPWLPAFFVFPIGLIAGLIIIVLWTQQWDLLAYLFGAIVIGGILALITRFTVGRKMEKRMGMGLI